MKHLLLWTRWSCLVFLTLWLWAGAGEAQKGQAEQPEQHGQPGHHPSIPLDEYIALLEDPKRDAWQQPAAVIQALGLHEGQIIADVGAGSGYFTLHLARAVGPTGTVFAVDVDAGMLNYLRQRLAKEALTNVRVRQVPPHDPLLIDGSLDLAFVCNTYHHIADRDVYLRKLRKALKPAGRLVIVDFYKDKDMPVGPPAHMRLSADAVKKELQEAELEVAETLTLLPYQYILVARPKTGEAAPSPPEES